MSFTWPLALLALLAVPLLAGALRLAAAPTAPARGAVFQRRPDPGGAPRRAAWRRHVPVALLLAALAALGLAAARPQVSVDVPVSESALILALDVSGSMCATDVEPNRLTAAQAAVRDFVQAQDFEHQHRAGPFRRLRAGRVAPTTEREPLLHAIDSLTTGRGTTIGAAILKSVDAIAEINPEVAPADPGGAAPGAVPRVPGSYAPEIVVLLTDGANTRGIEPVDAAEIAADAGCACTRSGSARGTRRTWSARRRSSAAGASRAAGVSAAVGEAATTWSRTRPPCSGWRM